MAPSLVRSRGSSLILSVQGNIAELCEIGKCSFLLLLRPPIARLCRTVVVLLRALPTFPFDGGNRGQNSPCRLLTDPNILKIT